MRLPSLPSCLSCLALLLAFGCGQPRFVYDVGPSFRAGTYQTVAVDPRKDRIVIREGMRPLNPELHLQAVLAELDTRKYHPMAAPAADLWVSVYLLIGTASGEHRGGPAKSSHAEGTGGGRHGGGRGGSGMSGKGEGESKGRGGMTLIVQLEDRKKGLPVWYGEATFDATDKGRNGGPLSIEEMVHQLLLPLP